MAPGALDWIRREAHWATELGGSDEWEAAERGRPRPYACGGGGEDGHGVDDLEDVGVAA